MNRRLWTTPLLLLLLLAATPVSAAPVALSDSESSAMAVLIEDDPLEVLADTREGIPAPAGTLSGSATVFLVATSAFFMLSGLLVRFRLARGEQKG